VEYNDRGREPSFGQLSLQQLQAGRLDDRQLE
jgi:hypothetical protein